MWIRSLDLQRRRSKSSRTGKHPEPSWRTRLTLGRDSPDLHHPQTTANLSALLNAPINSYQSVLTLLALQQYSALLAQQPYSTRRTLAHSLVSSVLKNETIIETPEDVNGILEFCHVLIRDQTDATGPAHSQQLSGKDPRRGPYHHERDELAEEQGWVARLIHLFRSDNLSVQFEVRGPYTQRYDEV